MRYSKRETFAGKISIRNMNIQQLAVTMKFVTFYTSRVVKSGSENDNFQVDHSLRRVKAQAISPNFGAGYPDLEWGPWRHTPFLCMHECHCSVATLDPLPWNQP